MLYAYIHTSVCTVAHKGIYELPEVYRFMKSEILFIQRCPAHGYMIKTELVENPDPSGDPLKMRNAYNLSGAYIGDRKTAELLCEERGIIPETISSDHSVCSIGFCEKEQKWYGWSHRAIFGFGIGSSVKRGDLAHVPDDVEELAKGDEEWNESVEIIDDETIRVSILKRDIAETEEEASLILKETEDVESYEVKTGRGEWTAKTLDDARQMAIDFANGVA